MKTWNVFWLGALVAYSSIARAETTSNLIQNPHMTFDLDKDGIPDHWVKGAADASHRLTWVEGPLGRGKILRSEYTGESSPNWFCWWQRVFLDPNTWYEFSASLSVEGFDLVLGSDGRINRASFWNGASVDIRNSSGTRLSMQSLYVSAHALSGWDEEAWVYRTHKTKEPMPWRTRKTYFKTTKEASWAQVQTIQYPVGVVYLDDVSLRKVDADLSLPPFRTEGTLRFIQYKNKNFFPIIALGSPYMGGDWRNVIGLDEMREVGFNCATNSKTNTRQEWLDADMAMLVHTAIINYTPAAGVPNEWINDPGHLIEYAGSSRIKADVQKWKDFENILFFNGPDELQSNPSREGAWMEYLQPQYSLKSYVNDAIPRAYVLYNFGGNGVALTQSHDDLVDYYFPITNAITSTCNTPQAYPDGSSNPKITNCGEIVRRFVCPIDNREFDNQVLAMGLGVYWWSKWDGRTGWSFSTYIPFGIQRYQVFDQIINGAVGVNFYGLYKSDLTNRYYKHHWEQVKGIVSELSSLNDVLLEPAFYANWIVSDRRISIMMKKHDGLVYLLCASTHHEDLSNIRIQLRLGADTIISITALNETAGGDFALGECRVIAPESSMSFVDNFRQQRLVGLEPADPDAPGYCVHVYEIETVRK